MGIVRPAAVLLLLLTAGSGCGNDDDSSDGPEAAAQVSESPTQPPELLESETCRQDMGPIVDLMLANEVDDLDLQTFSDRFARLLGDINDAVLACTEDVVKPARLAMYEFSVADARFTLCMNDLSCRFDDETLQPIQEKILAGIESAREAQTALLATE